jgi:hypothetical protein
VEVPEARKRPGHPRIPSRIWIEDRRQQLAGTGLRRGVCGSGGSEAIGRVWWSLGGRKVAVWWV